MQIGHKDPQPPCWEQESQGEVNIIVLKCCNLLASVQVGNFEDHTTRGVHQ